jgi:integrase
MISKTKEGTWRVKVKSHGRQIASRTFKRRADALNWEAEQKRRLQTGDWIDPKRGQETMESVVARWLEIRNTSVAGKTYQTDEYLLRLHLPASLRKRPIATVRPSDIETAFVRMNEKASINSVSRFRGTLSSMFAWAVRERIIRENPVTAAKLPSGTGQDATDEIYPFSLDELHAVVADLETKGGRWAELALVLGLTGMRWGELMALRVRDMQQVPYPAIRISRSAPDGQEIRNVTKGGTARTVPLVEELVPIFQRWSEGRPPDALVFGNAAGNRIGGKNWVRKVNWTAHCRGRRIHDLRHSAATIWLSNGLDPKTVQTWLGHASMTLTVDRYSHFMGNDADVAAVAKMNRILGGESGAKRKPGNQAGRP